MTRVASAPLLALALLLGACGQAEMSADGWRRMSAADKDLFVRSLIGGEAAASAKGGEGRTYSKPPAEYVELLDARYREGEKRSVEQLWGELADEGSPQIQ